MKTATITRAADPELPKPDHVQDLLRGLRQYLGVDNQRQWRLVVARQKLRKLLFEIEETGPAGTRLLIGKTHSTDRALETYRALQGLWKAGFRPPSAHTVVEPIGYWPQERLLLQEKATGTQLADDLQDPARIDERRTERAAEWLAALHQTSLDAVPTEPREKDRTRWSRELAVDLPQEAGRLERMQERVTNGFARRQNLVLTHGDYHPMNIFLADSGRVTVIDFDTFNCAERCTDVAYFLAQTAIMGYFSHGDFAASAKIRQTFLRRYEELIGPLPKGRIGLHIASAFLQSLHYERCVLHTGNDAIVPLWLDMVERSLDGDVLS